jgi:indole-3-glycerol phosphate synthase
MPASLDQILSAARQRVSAARRSVDVVALERAAANHLPRGFERRLREVSGDGIAVISELKKASPSKGLIRADFEPVGLARELEKAGAAALSVLTDEQFFQGSLDYLSQASTASSLPCLRKDFMVDEFQMVEARANRADAILLIVAALAQKELVSLAQSARSYQLDVLCEAHDEQELQRAVDAGCSLIGVNSRDLRTFQVSLDTAFRLVEKIPEGCLAISESGIHTGADLARLRTAGYDAFLIGESLMKMERPGKALVELLQQAEVEAGSSNLQARSS